MPTLENLLPGDLAELEATKRGLNDVFSLVLANLRLRSDPSYFSPAVTLKSGKTLDSLPAKIIPVIIDELHQSGQLLVAVQTSPAKEKYGIRQIELADQSEQGKIIAAIFALNFIAISQANGADAANRMVEKVISQIIYNDILMQDADTPRGKLRTVTPALVGVFSSNTSLLG